MKYKLILLDLDNTLTPDLGMPPQKFMPSLRLYKTIIRASKEVYISLCTGRDKNTVLKIVNKFSLNSPQIIDGGARIIDSEGNDLWVCYVDKESVKKIFKLLSTVNKSFSIIVGGVEIVDKLPKKNMGKITAVLVYDLTSKEIVSLKKILLPEKNLNITINTDKGGNTVYITHKNGTKFHGITKLMNILNIKKEEAIGIGDGENDITLLLSCGLKVAMGNATKSLKKIADFVAPTVNNDGVAQVIEKFILRK